MEYKVLFTIMTDNCYEQDGGNQYDGGFIHKIANIHLETSKLILNGGNGRRRPRILIFFVIRLRSARKFSQFSGVAVLESTFL